jgi:hypothetical protein
MFVKNVRRTYRYSARCEDSILRALLFLARVIKYGGSFSPRRRQMQYLPMATLCAQWRLSLIPTESYQNTPDGLLKAGPLFERDL